MCCTAFQNKVLIPQGRDPGRVTGKGKLLEGCSNPWKNICLLQGISLTECHWLLLHSCYFPENILCSQGQLEAKMYLVLPLWTTLTCQYDRGWCYEACPDCRNSKLAYQERAENFPACLWSDNYLSANCLSCGVPIFTFSKPECEEMQIMSLANKWHSLSSHEFLAKASYLNTPLPAPHFFPWELIAWGVPADRQRGQLELRSCTLDLSGLSRW